MKTSSCSILASAILLAADGEAAPRSLRSLASTEVNKSKNNARRDESSLTVVSLFCGSLIYTGNLRSWLSVILLSVISVVFCRMNQMGITTANLRNAAEAQNCSNSIF